MNLTINFGNESKVFIKGGIVGLGFVLLLFLYELYLISNGMEKRISSLSILSLAISFYFVNALKHFIIFGLSWHYLKKIKPYHSKIKLVVISVFGGIGGVIIMFIIQIGNLIFIENFSRVISVIVYPTPFWALGFFGLTPIFMAILISNAVVGITAAYFIAYKLGKQNVK